MPRIGHLLRAYFAGVNTMGPPLARRWALCREEDKTQWTASTISTWLHAAFNTSFITGGHAPPPPPICFCSTSHNISKGAASAAYAIKVPLTDIRYAGGWSTSSTVLESKYIEFTMRPTQATLLIFGYLKKDTPS